MNLQSLEIGEHDVLPLQIDESMLLPFVSHISPIVLNVANDFSVQENSQQFLESCVALNCYLINGFHELLHEGQEQPIFIFVTYFKQQ